MGVMRIVAIWVIFLAGAYAVGANTEQNCTITEKIDLAIVYDGSADPASTPGYFTALKAYIKNFIGWFNIDPKDGTVVGVWSYTSHSFLQFNFHQVDNNRDAVNIIDFLRPTASDPANVAKLLDFLTVQVFKKDTGSRYNDPNTKKVAIVVVAHPFEFDGTKHNPTAVKSKLEVANIAVHFVTVGNEPATLKDKITEYLPTNSAITSVTNLAGLQRNLDVQKIFETNFQCSTCMNKNSCLNGGSCVDVVDGFRCNCSSGWTGELCESNSTLVANCSVCQQNNGNCQMLGNGSVTCVCSKGKHGDNCQLFDICELVTNLCNGGKCKRHSSLSGQFTCVCPPNKSGRKCEKATCTPNPCNGYNCLGAGKTVKCFCPSECKSPTCQGCQPINPSNNELCVGANPCQNNCSCVKSDVRENGLYCKSSDGYLGKFCQIEKADIECGPAQIKITVPQAALLEYEAGTTGAVMYSSTTSKIMENCEATYDVYNKKYVINIAPNDPKHETCGTSTATEFATKVWLNRKSKIISVPYPILNFKCDYKDSFRIASVYLQPKIQDAPPLLSRGGSFNVSLTAYKDPPTSSTREVIAPGSVYTVSERLYLTATLELPSPPNPELVLRLEDCWMTSSVNSLADKTDIVLGGCGLPTFEARVLENGVSPSATISFLAFKISNSNFAFYSCKVKVCSKTDAKCLRQKACNNAGRKKRSSSDDEKQPLTRTSNAGPIIILTLEEKIKLQEEMKHGKVILMPLDDNRDEVKKHPDEERTVMSPLVIISTVNFILLLTLVIVVIILSNRHHEAKQRS